jgi:CheY-like chemotaxis protein
MNKNGPIVIIEDDEDDQHLFAEVLKELNYANEIIFFNDGQAALDYLISSTKQPFLILSDINMPKLNGFQLRDKVHNNEKLKLKCIPYLFFTTSAQQEQVIDAYSKSVQGFFTKPTSYVDLHRVIRNIIEYWKDCHSPNAVL